MTPIQLNIFASRVESICDEMGEVLKRTALSSNIKDRLDFSCALFDKNGCLFAQAAHIPVHLGSMAFAMMKIVADIEWAPGDMVMLNDPYLGGTHLPDITFIAPVFVKSDKNSGSMSDLIGFVVNRAHHANVGATTPGSMPLSTKLDNEGIVIPPTRIVTNDELDIDTLHGMFGTISVDECVADLDLLGDFTAQVSANRIGVKGLLSLAGGMGKKDFEGGIDELNAYGQRLAEHTLSKIPDGIYQFTDYLDDDGFGNSDISVSCAVYVKNHEITVDFDGSSEQVDGNINCPLSVTAAAVYYVFRCLMPEHTPACYGSFSSIKISAPEGCVLNAGRPAAVAAGNVETSTRVVDAVLGALAQAIPELVPAASQGSMNNVAMGVSGENGWDYYETIAGGMGAGSKASGLSARHSHMTNTLNTPVESLEMHYPLQVIQYAIRHGSGGSGKFIGGDGLVRTYYFMVDTEVTLLTERRSRQPWGLYGGESGCSGRNELNGERRPAKCHMSVRAGDQLTIRTPGGGGWGNPYE